jgi:hypothetical protein
VHLSALAMASALYATFSAAFMLAAVSEGLIYRPSSCGPALTGSAGTEKARRRQAVAVPVRAAMRGLHLQGTPNSKPETICPKLSELGDVFPLCKSMRAMAGMSKR